MTKHTEKEAVRHAYKCTV